MSVAHGNSGGPRGALVVIAPGAITTGTRGWPYSPNYFNGKKGSQW